MPSDVDYYTMVYDRLVSKLGWHLAAAYCVICRFAAFDTENGLCRLPLRAIGCKLGLSPQAVQRALRRLCQAGYLEDLDAGLARRVHRLRPLVELPEGRPFTPIYEGVARALGFTTAIVHGRVKRYASMRDGACRASVATLAGVGTLKEPGRLGDRTVQRALRRLCQPGILGKPYIHEIPAVADRLDGAGRPRCYMPTEAYTRRSLDSGETNSERQYLSA